MHKKLFLIILCTLTKTFCFSQDLIKMDQWQDSLVKLSNQVFGQVSEAERIQTNFKFVKALVSSLKETNAFYYSYDKLKGISIVNSPDNKFRIFSWALPLDDGSYLYYGSIQHQSSTIKLTPLQDKTFQIANVNQDVLKANEWYGSRYYDIVSFGANRYILLGWKGHHAEYSKKVIEILNIHPNDDVTFGAKVFSDVPSYARKIFSFTRQTSMYLKFNKENNRIEFDHIVQADPNMEINYKFFGPDLTYDAYSMNNNKLNFVENIQIQNDTQNNEDSFIDPQTIKKTKKSGLYKTND